MARPRTFDEGRALDAAMHAFWANGYEATSTQDLCEATGLGRSSIYNTFSSKHDLFKRSLARYIELMTVPQIELLEDPELPRWSGSGSCSRGSWRRSSSTARRAAVSAV